MSGIVRNRWDVVAAYALLGAATQVLWLTFAPITTAAAEHYGVGEVPAAWRSTAGSCRRCAPGRR